MRKVCKAILVVIGCSPMKRIGPKRSRLEPIFPVDTDAMIQVSGLAVIALVACALDDLRIARALPGVALAAGVEYGAGLIFIGRRATAARINRRGLFDQIDADRQCSLQGSRASLFLINFPECT